jgi:hypothetical protein
MRSRCHAGARCHVRCYVSARCYARGACFSTCERIRRAHCVLVIGAGMMSCAPSVCTAAAGVTPSRLNLVSAAVYGCATERRYLLPARPLNELQVTVLPLLLLSPTALPYRGSLPTRVDHESNLPHFVPVPLRIMV